MVALEALTIAELVNLLPILKWVSCPNTLKIVVSFFFSFHMSVSSVECSYFNMELEAAL